MQILNFDPFGTVLWAISCQSLYYPSFFAAYVGGARPLGHPTHPHTNIVTIIDFVVIN